MTTPPASLHQQDLRVALDRALNHLSQTIRSTFVLFAELGLELQRNRRNPRRPDRHGDEPDPCRP